jgi:hypothetical protein
VKSSQPWSRSSPATSSIDEVIQSQKFKDEPQKYINNNFGGWGPYIRGNHNDGEITYTEVAEDVEILKFSIISDDKDTVGTILSVRVPAGVTFLFIDEGASWYDSEAASGIATTKQLEDSTIRVYVELDCDDVSIC